MNKYNFSSVDLNYLRINDVTIQSYLHQCSRINTMMDFMRLLLGGKSLTTKIKYNEYTCYENNYYCFSMLVQVRTRHTSSRLES